MSVKKLSYDETRSFILAYANSFSDLLVGRWQSSIFGHFYVNEILSDDYLNTLYKILSENTGNTSDLYEQISDSLVYSTELDANTEQQNVQLLRNLYSKVKEFYPKYFVKPEPSNNRLLRIISHVLDHVHGKNEITVVTDFLTEMVTDDDKYINSSDAVPVINYYLTNCESAGSLDTIERIKQLYSKYDMYPVVLLNYKVSDEDKVKVIQAEYNKNNEARIREYYIENRISADDIDTLIDASVVKNKHIKNKNKAIEKLLNWAFISTNPNRQHYTVNTIETSKKFKTNCQKFLEDPAVSTEFYNTYVEGVKRGSYKVRENYRSFLSNLYYYGDLYKSNDRLNYVLEILPTHPEFKYLGSRSCFGFADTIDMYPQYFMKGCCIDRSVIKRIIKEIDVTCDLTTSKNMYSLITDAGVSSATYATLWQHPTEGFKRLIPKFRMFYQDDYNIRSSYYCEFADASNIFKAAPDTLNMLNLLSEEEILAFGFTTDNVQPGTFYRRATLDNLNVIYTSFQRLLQQINDFNFSADENDPHTKAVNEIIIDKLYAPFENDENTEKSVTLINSLFSELHTTFKGYSSPIEIRAHDRSTTITHAITDIATMMTLLAHSVYHRAYGDNNDKRHDACVKNLGHIAAAIELIEETED